MSMPYVWDIEEGKEGKYKNTFPYHFKHLFLNSYFRKQFHIYVDIMVVPTLSQSQTHHQSSYIFGHVCWTGGTGLPEDNS